MDARVRRRRVGRRRARRPHLPTKFGKLATWTSSVTWRAMRAALRLQAAGGLAAPLCLCVLAVVAVCAPLIYIALLAVSVYSTPGLIRQLR